MQLQMIRAVLVLEKAHWEDIHHKLAVAVIHETQVKQRTVCFIGIDIDANRCKLMATWYQRFGMGSIAIPMSIAISIERGVAQVL